MRVKTPHLTVGRWQSRPARTLFKRLQRPPRDSDGIVTAFRDGEVTLRSRRREEGFTNAVQEFGYQGVRRGDLVIHSMDGFAGAIGVSDSDGKSSPVVHCYEPTARADARFYAYLIRDLAVRGFIQSLARGIRERSTAFDSETFRSLVLPWPPLTEQRAIADYLDAETSRIDALITTKRRVIELLDERLWAEVDYMIGTQYITLAPLRRFITRIADGPFGSSLTSSDYSDEGARVVRLGNIGFAKFRDDDKAFISREYFKELQRHKVTAGDLLIAGLGDSRNHVGRACVAPDLGEAIVKADCYCVRVDACRAVPEFLALYLSSPLGASNVALAARGTTRSRINVEIAKDIEVPVVSLDAQRTIIENAERSRSRVASTSTSLARQIELLAEHRQALVTAVVSGELEIPEVAA